MLEALEVCFCLRFVNAEGVEETEAAEKAVEPEEAVEATEMLEGELRAGLVLGSLEISMAEACVGNKGVRDL